MWYTVTKFYLKIKNIVNLRIKVLLLTFITAKAYETDREAIYEQVQDSNLVSSLHRIELEIV